MDERDPFADLGPVADSWRRPPSRGPGRPDPDRVLVVGGYLCALFLPIVGLVVGVVLVGRGNDHGWVIASLAVVVGVTLALAFS